MHIGPLGRALIGLMTAVGVGAPARADEGPGVRLYALDCGRVSLKDTGFLSDTGDLDGKPGKFAVPCYLIRHKNGSLLWDAGLGDAIAGRPANPNAPASVPVTLTSQLQSLGIRPEQVTYLAFSHHHSDHIGNADLFVASTWLISRAELAWSSSSPAPSGVIPGAISAEKAAHTRMIDRDLDVFGDGVVRIISTPGHTPGSQSLVVRLPRSGTVILTGDLYGSHEGRRLRRIPVGNTSRAETLASMDRVERIAKLHRARVIGQHDLSDFDAMPKLPAYLE